MISQQPLVSIIMPAYNSAATINMAALSVLNQDYLDIELIVVDDNSADNTASIVAALGDRVKVVVQDHAGVSVARNRGIEEAQGSLIGFCDSDDELLPWAVSSLIAPMLHNSRFGAVSAPMIEILPNRVARRPLRGLLLGAQVVGGEVSDWLASAADNVVVATGSGLFRADVLKSVGGFRTDLHHAEDLELWTRIACCCPWYFVDKPVLLYFNNRPLQHKTLRYLTDQPHWLMNEHDMRQRVPLAKWASYRHFRREAACRSMRWAAYEGQSSLARSHLRLLRPADMLNPKTAASVALALLPGNVASHLAGIRSKLGKYEVLSRDHNEPINWVPESELSYDEAVIVRGRLSARIG